jgi:glycosyltransferase involved in cell wall biosynthesis
MRLLIDLQGYQTEASRYRGIGRYTRDIVFKICELSKNDEIIIALNGSYEKENDDITKTLCGHFPNVRVAIWNQIDRVNFWIEPGECPKETKARRVISEKMRELFFARFQPDFVLLSSLIEGTGNAISSIGHFKQFYPVATIFYDLIHLVYPDQYLNDYRIKQCYFSKISHLHRSDLIFTISESTRRDVINRLEIPDDKVVNISSACDQELFLPGNDKTKIQDFLTHNNIFKPYVLYTASLDSRKNLRNLVDAWRSLPDLTKQNYQLVIVCALKPHERDFVNHEFLDNDTLNSIIFTGHVSDELLAALYRKCCLFVFPSLYEGFGLPVLEAMSCGAPVIASNASAIPEILDIPEAMFDPNEPADITRQLENYLSSPILRNSLASRCLLKSTRFSWESSANILLDRLKSYLKQFSFKPSLKLSDGELCNLLMASIQLYVRHLPKSQLSGISKAISINFNIL